MLTKETKSEEDREALLELLETRKNDANENLIQNQASLIDSLRTRCDQYEKERMRVNSSGAAGVNDSHATSSTQVREMKEEINALRSLVHRLSAELSNYQSKYPQESPSLVASLKVSSVEMNSFCLLNK